MQIQNTMLGFKSHGLRVSKGEDYLYALIPASILLWPCMSNPACKNAVFVYFLLRSVCKGRLYFSGDLSGSQHNAQDCPERRVHAIRVMSAH